MLVFITIAFALLLAIAVVSTFIAGHLYGQQKMMNKMAVDAKRRERRSIKDLYLWQNKAIERAGLGSLHRRVYPDENQKPSRMITPLSTVIQRQRNADNGQVPEIKTERVPKAVENGFLKDAA